MGPLRAVRNLHRRRVLLGMLSGDSAVAFATRVVQHARLSANCAESIELQLIAPFATFGQWLGVLAEHGFEWKCLKVATHRRISDKAARLINALARAIDNQGEPQPASRLGMPQLELQVEEAVDKGAALTLPEC